MPAHKGDTKRFDELSFAEQAKTITAEINNLQAAISHHIAHSRSAATKTKCLAQVARLLARLREKYP